MAPRLNVSRNDSTTGQDGGAARYGWDKLGRMLYAATPAGGSSDYYRADGQRIEKVANASLTWFQASRTSGQYDLNFATSGASTRYFYDGQMGMEDDYNPSGSVTVVNRYGLGARGIDRVERTENSTTTYGYPLYDGHGNMRTTLGRNGTGYTTGTFKTYDVWGSVRSGGDSGDPTQKYCASLGHVSDSDSGLIYMRARYHEPSTGRFISQDPAMAGTNWFVYCGNEPVNHEDANGKWAVIALHAILFGVGFAAGWWCGSAFWQYALTTAVPGAGAHMQMVPDAADAALRIYNDTVSTWLVGGLSELAEVLMLTLGSAAGTGGAFLGTLGLGFAAGFLLSFYIGLIAAALADAAYVSEGQEAAAP